MGINVGAFIIADGKASSAVVEEPEIKKSAQKKLGRSSKTSKKEQPVVEKNSKPITKSSAYLVDMVTKDE